MAPKTGPFEAARLPRDLIRQTERGRTPRPVLASTLAATTAVAKQLPGRAVGEPGRFATVKAADLCQRISLSEQAALLLTSDLTPKQYLDLLTNRHLYPDAMRVLAYGLAKRQAVWWGCLCLREALGANPPPKTNLALETAEQWAKQPTDEHQCAGRKAAETAGFGTPAGLLALAAFWSVGSLTSPDGPTGRPADYMTAEGVACAVLLAAAGTRPEDMHQRYRRFLALGLAVACAR